VRPLPASRSSIAYFELGNPHGTPLLCLHGLSLSGYVFEQYHQHFVEKGMRAIAPCLLGGISISDSARTIHDLANEVIELMDGLGIERFDVIGFSSGTLPELALIARVPGRIRRAGLLGPMVPMKFFGARDRCTEVGYSQSLQMIRHAPALHRGLMWLVCRLPGSALVNQFKDENLSPAEADALAPGSTFSTQLARCISECVRTGSRFFTDGWRMFLDEPGYTLSDLAGVASRVDVRLYVGERDNVHLPAFADRIAAACCGIDADELERRVRIRAWRPASFGRWSREQSVPSGCCRRPTEWPACCISKRR
jgi:pimeloyl-ACP methyl ester carboxylesterase